MNFRIPVAGLLIGLVVACSDSKPNATVPSTPEQQQTHKSQLEVKQPSSSSSATPEVKVSPSPKAPGNIVC